VDVIKLYLLKFNKIVFIRFWSRNGKYLLYFVESNNKK